jgi:hypothetical protein
LRSWFDAKPPAARGSKFAAPVSPEILLYHGSAKWYYEAFIDICCGYRGPEGHIDLGDIA